MIKNFLALWILIISIFIGFICYTSTTKANTDDMTDIHFNNAETSIDYQKDGISAKASINNPTENYYTGTLKIFLKNKSGKVVESTTKDISISKNTTRTLNLNLPATIKSADLKDYTVEYQLTYSDKNSDCMPPRRCVSEENYITTTKSFYGNPDDISIKILGQDSLIAGSKASLRILAYNIYNGTPHSNSAVTINIEKNNSTIPLYTGKTDVNGTINANFSIPEGIEGQADLNITVKDKKTNIAESTIIPIKLKKAYKILLTSDKPIYQPTQTMKIRSLSLNSASQKPIGSKEAIIEVYDAKGNKVFKKITTTNEFGIAAADFTLADLVILGNYKIKAIVDNITSEKTVKVSKYVLPKYKVVIDTDKNYYLPAETLKGSVDANYFFGKPIDHGTVTVKLDKFDIGFSNIQEIKGKTDATGHFDFEFKLPDSFVGQKISDGNALLRLEAEVKDQAEHVEMKTTAVTVSQSPINISVIPESGALAKNLSNNIYVMTTYPDGTPAQTTVEIELENKDISLKTDQSGIGTFTIIPNEESISLTAMAKDSKGNQATKKTTLSTNNTDASVILRTENALTKVGERLNLDIISTKASGTAYLDIIKNGQTVLTKSTELKRGKADIPLVLSSDLAGTITLNAYIIDSNSEIIRDSQIIYVSPADDLVINVKTDQNTYKPGQEAIINFNVTDANKHPVLAALGIYIVDESVFALSEIQPGLEKVFFTLEQEILKPRYEIHALSGETVVKPFIENNALREKQDKAAKVLFAAAEEKELYDVKIDTGKEKITTLIDKFSHTLNQDQQKLTKAIRKYNKIHGSYKLPQGISSLVSEKLLYSHDLRDPWGNDYIILPLEKNNSYNNFLMISKGPDGKENTLDDIAKSSWYGTIIAVNTDEKELFNLAYDKNPDIKKLTSLVRNAYYQNREFEEGIMVFEAMDMRRAVGAGVALPQAAPMNTMKKEKSSTDKTATPDVRVREYFPETLYANPALITDEKGNASITLPMADSITTWRLSALGNSLNGLLGSTTAPIRVFQDFFIDIDLPVSLTENDEVSIPIAIYNYLNEEQSIKLVLKQEDWFETKSQKETTLKIGPNQVTVKYFDIKVKQLGHHTLTVYGYGSKLQDAIKREITVEPDGKEIRTVINGTVNDEVTTTVEIPKAAIDKASRVLVKLYPGYLSQVLEGMDNIFRMPHGCFEQTSSTTYPNVLVLDYLKRTNQLTPEVQMKAESYINSGYQRLLTFEVDGGGFDWFGNPPANKILTAYGLMEFDDMAAVHEVDPALISRTQNWLINKQEENGSWIPDEGGIAEGAINKYKGDTLRTTAYIGWALASTDYKGDALTKAVNYVKNNENNAKDAYTYAVMANLMAIVEPESPETTDIFNKLLDLKTEEKDLIYWVQKEETPMYGGGKSSNIETTALATIALINYGKHIPVTNKALNYLIKSKDSYGTWHSTQATILAMKALLMSIADSSNGINATVTVSHNGKKMETYAVNKDNSDVVKQIDLKDVTIKGDNTVKINIDGQGKLMYQIINIHYLPWAMIKKEPKELLSIDVSYDKTTLSTNDKAKATVSIQNNTDKTANMVIVDLGIPPGFEVQTEDFDKLVADKVITRYDTAARQIILYFEKLEPSEKLDFTYHLKAKYPIKAQSGKSKVYKYYQPEVNATDQPQEIVVN